MAFHPNLLELQRDSKNPTDLQEFHPFILSLRREHEFSDIHSYGFHKVPHIGIYAQEYIVTSTMVLLSLPPVPRCFQQLPSDLISALDLDFLLETNSCPGDHHHHDDVWMRTTARRLAAVAIEAACRRVRGERIQGEGYKELALWHQEERVLACEGGLNHCVKTEDESCMEIWNGRVTDNQLRPSTKRKVGFEEEEIVVSRDSTPMHVEEEKEAGIELERRSVARRLVLKCIRAACGTFAYTTDHRDSIENLISSTKRMRISSPSPLDEAVTIAVRAPLKPQSPLPDRALTPESMKMQKLRKKRGRSESHEVNSLIDYDMIRRQIRSSGSGGRDKKAVGEESATGNSASALSINSIVANLNTLTISESSGEEEEAELVSAISPHPMYMNSSSTASPTPMISTNFGNSNLSPTPMISTHYDNDNTLSPTPMVSIYCNNDTPSPTPMVATHESDDIRDSLSNDAVPDMDLYVMIHSHPPPALCQKFLCSNTDEINLLYHCWLFGDIVPDPKVVASEQLEVGVFDPSYVQPVHLDLQDSGAPFYHIDKRTVCIHSCSFSPDNNQLQLLDASPAARFHSFFSAARHGGRRVVSLHILPSSKATEKEVREAIKDCSTLKQLLVRLDQDFPEIGSKILSLVYHL